MYNYKEGYLLGEVEMEQLRYHSNMPILLDKTLFTHPRGCHKLKIYYNGTKEEFANEKDFTCALFVDLVKMRFGNTYVALLNLLHLIEKNNFSDVYLKQNNTSLKLEEVFDLGHLNITPISTYEIPFHKFTIELNKQNLYYLKTQRDFSKLRDNFYLNTTSYDINTIVIHIRSGDVFMGNGANAKYHQPPLVWYKFIINKHISQYGKSSVYLVYENNLNPVIDALKEWCESSSIPLYESYSKELKYDYRILFSAKVIVASCGTFLYVVRNLSKNLKLFYSYDDKYVRDYIVRGEWQNTKEQLFLMLSLPERNLAITDYQADIVPPSEKSEHSKTEFPDLDSMMNSAITYYSNAKFEKAQQLLLEYIVYAPTDHKAYNYLSKCFLHTNKLKLALSAYSKCIYDAKFKLNMHDIYNIFYILSHSTLENKYILLIKLIKKLIKHSHNPLLYLLLARVYLLNKLQ